MLIEILDDRIWENLLWRLLDSQSPGLSLKQVFVVHELLDFGISICPSELKIPNPGMWTNIIENHLPKIAQDSMFPAEKGFKSVINNK